MRMKMRRKPETKETSLEYEEEYDGGVLKISIVGHWIFNPIIKATRFQPEEGGIELDEVKLYSDPDEIKDYLDWAQEDQIEVEAHGVTMLLSLNESFVPGIAAFSPDVEVESVDDDVFHDECLSQLEA